MATSNLSIVISAIDRATSVIGKVSSSMTNFAEKNRETFDGMTKAGGLLTATLVGLGIKSVQTASKFETYRTVLTNLHGSSEKAAEDFNMLQEFAASTPYSLDELTGSYIKFKNRGLDYAAEGLTKIGDLAASQGKSFDQLTEAILDATSGEFERLKEFGIKASQSANSVTLSFKDQVVEIEKTPEAIRKAIESFGELQGVQGGMAAQAATTAGKLSNLGDSMDKLFDTIGTSIKPILDPLLDKIINLTAALGSFTMAHPALITNILAFGTAIGGALTAVGSLGLILPSIVAGVGALLSPIGLVTIAIAGLGAAFATNFAGMKDTIDKYMPSILESFEKLRVSIPKTLNQITRQLSLIRETHRGRLEPFLQGLRDHVTRVFSIAADTIGGVLTGMFNTIQGIRNALVSFLAGERTLAWEGIEQVLKGTVGVLESIFQGFKDYVVGIFDDIGKIIKGVLSQIGLAKKEAASAQSSASSIPSSQALRSTTGKRAVGGLMMPGIQYLAGELGPELITPLAPSRASQPSSTPISVNINLGSVSINNGSDENAFVKLIDRAVKGAFRDLRLGIA